jgi:hypothetical protein
LDAGRSGADQGRHELPARDGLRYTLAVDPSGGGADALTVSVVHAEGSGADLCVVQDLLKGLGGATLRSGGP